MYAPHTVTVYNAQENVDTLKIEHNITILKGVFLDISKAANVAKSGLVNADAATLFIPMSIKAINGKTGAEQTYLPPKEYMSLGDPSAHWTIRASGVLSNKDCFFVKGEVVDERDFEEINASYDDVYRVSSVDPRDFGSEHMRHWEVSGK